MVKIDKKTKFAVYSDCQNIILYDISKLNFLPNSNNVVCFINNESWICPAYIFYRFCEEHGN